MVHFVSIRHPATILDDLHGKVLNEAYQISKSTVTDTVSTEMRRQEHFRSVKTVELLNPNIQLQSELFNYIANVSILCKQKPLAQWDLIVFMLQLPFLNSREPNNLLKHCGYCCMLLYVNILLLLTSVCELSLLTINWCFTDYPLTLDPHRAKQESRSLSWPRQRARTPPRSTSPMARQTCQSNRIM